MYHIKQPLHYDAMAALYASIQTSKSDYQALIKNRKFVINNSVGGIITKGIGMSNFKINP